jgi:alkylation response protein AidB-like acyl-CoA dehydrogenase
MIDRDPKRVADLLEKIQSLAPLVEQHRGALDRERRLPALIFDALADVDLLRLWVPKALGGPELSPLDFMEVVEAASELDGSIGWIVGNGAGMSRIAGYLPEGVSRAWFADPRAFVASATGAVGTAIPVKGGYRVAGRWPFGSGIHHATTIMGLCSVARSDNPNPPELISCHFAPACVSVTDNWHVSGLRGTGSCDFEVREVFVSTEHTHDFLAPRPTQPGLLYRMPPLSVFALTVSAVPLGIARSAISNLITLANRKIRAGTTLLLRDRETIQSEVGRAEATHMAARAFLVEAIDELMRATEIGGERLIRARAFFRVACSHAAESALRIVDMMATVAGAAAIFETCALERCVRDVHAAVKHVAMSPNNYIVAGRISLGLEPGTVRF